MTNKGLFQRLVLAAVLAVGFLGVWGMLGLWTLEVGREAVIRHAEWESERLEFRTDGSPVVIHSQGFGREQQIRDLAGNAVTLPEDDPSPWLYDPQLPASLPLRIGSGDVGWEDRIRSFDDGRNHAVHWHFVSDGRPDGTAYFAGYDGRSKVCVGYLDVAGFRTEMPPPGERFPFGGALRGTNARLFCPEPERRPNSREAPTNTPPGALSPWMVYILGRDQKLYEADLRQRTVRVLLDDPGLRSLALVGVAEKRTRGSFHRLAVRTNETVLLLDDRGRLLRSYPIPEALRAEPFAFAEITAGEALMHWNSPEDFLARQVEHRVFWVSSDGRYRSAEVTLLNCHPMQSAGVFVAAVLPSPLALDAGLGSLMALGWCEDGRAATYPEAMGLFLRDFWPAVAIAQLLAAFLALMCYRREVRYATARWERAIWPLFVLLLGLPGWIGYRFGRSWPVLEACPECGVRVPRDCEACACCEADFSPPALKGIEVFT
jgi:hypothetical protein